MYDIRWLDIPAEYSEVSKHPAAFFISIAQHSVFRVLQVRFENGEWCDVPVIRYIMPNEQAQSAHN